MTRSWSAISGFVVVGLILAACSATDEQPSGIGASGGASTNLGGTSATANGGAVGSTTGGSAPAVTGGAPARNTGGASNSATGGALNLATGGTLANATGGATSNATGGRSVNASGGAVSTSTGGSIAAATGGVPTNATGGTIATATGGASTRPTGGSAGAARGGAAATGGAKSTGGATTASTGGSTSSTLEKFSFFVASQVAMVRLSGSTNGFGGDLRYGTADGLTGADKICTEIAEASMPGSGAKGWRAFLSATSGPSGTPVNAIDRIGSGPWYDRLGRVVALNKTALANARPQGADPAIINDLPNETGTPNHAADGTIVDNHDTLTGSTAQGLIGSTTRANTCNDWTSSVGTTGKPQIGHSWPRSASNGTHWIADHTAPGCGAGVNTGSQNGSGTCVGCSGGYGGIYCFALQP